MFTRVMKKKQFRSAHMFGSNLFPSFFLFLSHLLYPLFSFCLILTHHLLLCHRISPSSEDFNSWMNSATVLLLSSVLVSVQGFEFTQKDGLWLSNFIIGSPKNSQGSHSLRNTGGAQGLGPC